MEEKKKNKFNWKVFWISAFAIFMVIFTFTIFKDVREIEQNTHSTEIMINNIEYDLDAIKTILEDLPWT